MDPTDFSGVPLVTGNEAADLIKLINRMSEWPEAATVSGADPILAAFFYARKDAAQLMWRQIRALQVALDNSRSELRTLRVQAEPAGPAAALARPNAPERWKQKW